ncbi:hypothetical protein BZG35_08420 [Brevundimonas sp. LM2]|uniref:RNA polymerase sigma factor n=1 Tax=Brevundimonas sp. LM2 TaxID=1938605 RepID=UPI000983CFB6|nr:RNA polymerase sigma factor [Brevundimonas sp. LM2]AQR61672.1 hypothetical protein BZG35_08420 [Brevundimonas sp. LM2]
MSEPATRAQWDELYGWLVRQTGDPSLASDLAQDAYARLAAVSDDIVVLDRRAWLFGVARNLLVDHWRVRGRTPATVPADTALVDHADPQPDPLARLLSAEELTVLNRAIAALPPRMGEVFRLHKVEHLSYEAIALRLGMAKNTVMVHMVQALGRCRAALIAHRESR